VVDPYGEAEDWTNDSARVFVEGGVGLLSDMAARVAGVDGGALAILNVSSKSRELIYVTDAVAERIDELQFLLGEGPCLDAYRSGRPNTAADLAAAHSIERWPAFAREAMGAGANAVFAYPVGSRAVTVGVLELYRRTSGALNAQQHDAAMQYAEAIGIVLNAAWQGLSRRFGDLTADHIARLADSSPLSRKHVHVAAGMVAEQLGISVGEAMDRVRAFAYASGQRLLDVSEDILAHRVSLPSGHDERGGSVGSGGRSTIDGLRSRSAGHESDMTQHGTHAHGDDDSPKDAVNPPPGPADHGREGGMATREVAPDVVKKSDPNSD
jgi:hypothetical protein